MADETPPPVEPAEVPSPRAAIHRQAASISLALAPFGVAFGIAAQRAGAGTLEAMGFSTLVFTGGSQFAAVTTLAAGGGVLAAVTAGALLALRLLAFGVAIGPDLHGPWWKRALMAQLMIDESTAVGTAQHDPRWRRYGYLVTGIAMFVVWNVSTFLGVVVLSDASSAVHDYGIDATIPAAFIALLWPRLADGNARVLAVAGAAIAFLLVPVAPAGVPIVAAAVAVGLDGRVRS